ncbi:MAG: PQQ-dependent sugar dehydrogenase, partial [Verrucomicrobiales bacterium]|nr:PQQ-dependent sugar dehydrogenase [Verrucomicrobiales bacterium]
MSLRLASTLFSLALSATIAAREPWTTSRIQGSPEPPRPYITEQVFTSLPMQNVLEIIALPGQTRLLMVEDKGPVWSVSDQPDAREKHLVIDLSKAHKDLTHVYGIACHPNYQENKQIFLTYTLASGLDDGTKLSRFKLSSIDPLTIDPASEEILLTWRSGGHNGANLRFGPDGMLYISTGDSEVPAPPDPLNTGQDNSDLLSNILRIDVDHPSAGLLYSVPQDNPFVGKENVRGEIWAFGLRNPWKMAFAPDGRLWCGDVGWELWEMIH